MDTEWQARAVDFVNRLPPVDDGVPLMAAIHPHSPISIADGTEDLSPDSLLTSEFDAAAFKKIVAPFPWDRICLPRQPLSSSWHHLPCVTAGLPDPRPVHPVAAAIGRQARAVAPGLTMPKGFE